MLDRFLTGSRGRPDDRRTATPMLVFALALLAPLASTRADERVTPPPPLLMSHVLHARGLDEHGHQAAIEAARWTPRLALSASYERASGSWPHNQALLLARLSWPLERSPGADAIADQRARRQAGSERQRLVDRIAATWERRRQADELEDDLAAELTAEETEAELDVLSGRADEDGP
jgi:hypothetical protein